MMTFDGFSTTSLGGFAPSITTVRKRAVVRWGTHKHSAALLELAARLWAFDRLNWSGPMPVQEPGAFFAEIQFGI